MICRLVKLFSMVINPIGYFVVVYWMAALLVKRGLSNILTGSTIAVIGPGLALLWCGTYTGTWISVAERDCRKFLKYFLLLDLLPGLVGAVVAMFPCFRP
jgi:cyanate permease